MEEKAELEDQSTEIVEPLVAQSNISKVMRKMSVNIGLFSSQKSQKSLNIDDSVSSDTDTSDTRSKTPSITRGYITPYSVFSSPTIVVFLPYPSISPISTFVISTSLTYTQNYFLL